MRADDELERLLDELTQQPPVPAVAAAVPPAAVPPTAFIPNVQSQPQPQPLTQSSQPHALNALRLQQQQWLQQQQLMAAAARRPAPAAPQAATGDRGRRALGQFLQSLPTSDQRTIGLQLFRELNVNNDAQSFLLAVKERLGEQVMRQAMMVVKQAVTQQSSVVVPPVVGGMRQPSVGGMPPPHGTPQAKALARPVPSTPVASASTATAGRQKRRVQHAEPSAGAASTGKKAKAAEVKAAEVKTAEPLLLARPLTAAQPEAHAPPSQQQPLDESFPLQPAPLPSSAHDVSKMDSNSLQDVMEYAGVNIKEESEWLMRQSESRTTRSGGRRPAAAAQAVAVVLNPALVQRMEQAAEGRPLEAEVPQLMQEALMDYVHRLLTQSVLASRSRLECGRDSWQLEVVDGPAAVSSISTLTSPLLTTTTTTTTTSTAAVRSRVGTAKRPLVWLERCEREAEARAARLLHQALSEEGRRVLAESGLSLPSSSSGEKGKRGAEPTREELAVRARLTNVTALQAAGWSKYAWMNNNNNTGAASTTAATPTAAATATTTAAAVGGGGFGLPRPGIRKRLLQGRRVALKDVLLAMQLERSRGGSWSAKRHSAPVAKAYSVLLNNDR